MGVPVAADERFRARVLDALPQLVLVVQGDGLITFASGQVPRRVQLDVPALVGRNAAAWIHPDDLHAVLGALTVAGEFSGEVVGPLAFRYFDDVGQERVVEGLAWDQLDDPELAGLVVLVRDIVGPNSVEMALADLADGAGLDAVASHILEAVAEPPLDGAGWVLRAEPGEPVPTLLAISPLLEDMIGEATGPGPWVDLASGAHFSDGGLHHVPEQMAAALRAHGLLAMLAVAVPVHSSPEVSPLRLVAFCPWADEPSVNQLRYLQRYGRVLSLAYERIDLEMQLIHAAGHDPLTGLANRATFMRWLHEPVVVERDAEPVTSALLYLDLDGFKPVNDGFGHAAGDAVLVEIARRLSATVRDGDGIARLGGDEFAVLLRGTKEEDAVELARRLLGAVAQPIEVAGAVVTVGASIGVAVGRGLDLEPLLERADGAMYNAKHGGRGSWRLVTLF
jgi:diguanylate cyclase (GGDEF)-like protein